MRKVARDDEQKQKNKKMSKQLSIWNVIIYKITAPSLIDHILNHWLFFILQSSFFSTFCFSFTWQTQGLSFVSTHYSTAYRTLQSQSFTTSKFIIMISFNRFLQPPFVFLFNQNLLFPYNYFLHVHTDCHNTQSMSQEHNLCDTRM